jgi:hypothetical protein
MHTAIIAILSIAAVIVDSVGGNYANAKIIGAFHHSANKFFGVFNEFGLLFGHGAGIIYYKENIGWRGIINRGGDFGGFDGEPLGKIKIVTLTTCSQ